MGPDELRRQALLEERHFWYAARRRQVARRLRPAPCSDARALDLGAGSGGNTRLLAEAGYRAVALEHHPLAADMTHSRGIDVVRGDGHHLPFSDATFDAVLACDVLEHLSRDDEAVAEVHRVLRPGGQFLLTVPADPRLWSEHDVALQHHRRYTRASLQSLLETSTFTVDTLTSWMVLLRPAVALRRRLGRGASAIPDDEPVSDLEEVSAPLNAVLGLALRLEHHLPWLGRRAGVSLIADATKLA